MQNETDIRAGDSNYGNLTCNFGENMLSTVHPASYSTLYFLATPKVRTGLESP
jgi:hypothetical protein